jgi:hypothetical protein
MPRLVEVAEQIDGRGKWAGRAVLTRVAHRHARQSLALGTSNLRANDRLVR